jgi:hypothetical protein
MMGSNLIDCLKSRVISTFANEIVEDGLQKASVNLSLVLMKSLYA